MITQKQLMSSMLAIYAATASSLVLAESYPQTEPTQEVFHIGIEGNYLWQSDNTAQLESTPNDFVLVALPLINETPGGSWGGGIDVGYRFTPRYDISASYFFLRADDFLNDTRSLTFDASVTRKFPVKNKLTRDFDSADILLGTYFKPSNRWLVRLGYGLGFARIAQTSKDSFVPPPDDNAILFNETTSENDFIGLGPKVTLGADFKLAKHFYVIGEAGLSVLYGKSKSKLSISGIADPNEIIIPPSTYKQDNYQGALGFEGRIGAAYVTPVSKNAVFNLEAGFKGQSYVNALQDDAVDYAVVSGGESGTTVTDFDGTYNNFGPYINLSMDFK